MPTYEYKCAACGHAFEKFQSMSAAPVKTCPSCGAPKAERQISGGAGFIFKGGGFYETDYRSEAYKKSAEADKAPSADAKPAAEAKPGEAKAADAKPAESKPSEAKPAETAKPVAPAPTTSAAAKTPPTPPPAGG